MTDQPSMSKPMVHTLVVAGAVLVVLLLTLGGCGRDRTVVPTATPTPDFWERMEAGESVIIGGSRYLFYATPATQAPDLFVWAGAYPVATPIPRPAHDDLTGNYPVGMICLTGNLDTVWPSAGAAGIFWGDEVTAGYDDCFSDTATFTITLGSGQVISQPVILDFPPDFYAPGGTGADSANAYGLIYMASWLKDSSTYVGKMATGTPSGAYYNGIHYENLATVIPTMIAAAGARYTATPEAWDRIAAIRLRVGSEGEPYPIMPQGSDDDTATLINNLLTRHQTEFASCAEYKTWIETLAGAAAAAFPGKPILIMSSGPYCASTSPEKMRATVVADMVATGTPVGLSQNLFQSHRSDAAAPTAYPWQAYKNYTTIEKADSLGFPGMAEFAENSEGAYANDAHSDGDNWQEWYWAVMQGFGAQADWVRFPVSWRSYISTWGMWIGDCMSDAKCGAIFFRDVEDPTYAWNVNTDGSSDWRGDLSRNLTLPNATDFPQSCRQSLDNAAATSVAAVAGSTVYDPAPCGGDVLPTPAWTIIPYATRDRTAVPTVWPTPVLDATAEANMLQRLANRQARYINATDAMAITIDDSWAYAGDSWEDTAIRLVYLDSSSDDFVIGWNTAAGAQATRVVNRSGSGIWKTESFDATLYTGGAITITNSSESDKLWVHMLGIDLGEDETPTPTSTPTASLTPTETYTPSPTPTGSTPTPTSTQSPMPAFTPTNTSTPAWTPISCPTIAVTVDGGLSEWAAVTPVALSYSSAGYVEAAATVTATPAAANASANFYCGWSGSTLYFAGVISDATLLPPEGAYRNGDAALVSVDGRGDGFTRLRADDHDLYIPAPASGTLGSAMVLDYDAYPVGVTAVVAATGSGWQFEMSVPNSIHQGGTFTTNSIIGIQYGIYDRDGGSNATYQIVAHRRRGDMD